MDLCIVLPVRNRKVITRAMLVQLRGQIQRERDAIEPHLVVVDDGSTDGTPELIQAEFPQVHVIEGDGDLWWAGAINVGMKFALEQFPVTHMIWLNDDLMLAEDWFSQLLGICQDVAYQDTIVGGIVCSPTYPNWIVYSGMQGRTPITQFDRFQSTEAIEVDALCGNIVVIPVKIIHQMGWLDTKKLPHYGADHEYVIRATKAGFRAVMSRKLQASTEFSLQDFIRYMPYWMQWYLQPGFSKRWKVIRNLVSLKGNHNVWVVVNLHADNRNLQWIAPWKYVFCFFNKILRLAILGFVPKRRIESRIKEYLQLWQPPQEIADEILSIR